MSSPVKLLTVAGSDSGGGAGIQADLKTFSAFLAYGMSVVTAITAQNTLGVHSVEAVSAAMVQAQFEAVASDIEIQAIKTGMLFSRDIIHTLVTSFAKLYSIEFHLPIVVDPVCVSTSGHTLLSLDGIEALRTELIPWATVITPNIPEGELLAGVEMGSVQSREGMRDCARIIGKLGCRWVLLKGGHRPEVRADGTKWTVDLLWDSLEEADYLYERPFIVSTSTHGTGCTLSAALAAELGRGKTMQEAVQSAGDYVYTAIATAFPLGKGHGPVNHLHSLTTRTFSLPTLLEPHPFTSTLIARNAESWNRYVNHPFPTRLADGTLPLSSFLYFLRQDYHFLLHYARTYSLAAVKSSRMEDIASSMEVVQSVVKETENHIAYCARHGITKDELLSSPESIVNIAYNRYVLDVASTGNLLDLEVATAPCLMGYGQVGKRLFNATEGVDRSAANDYWSWISEYGGPEFQGVVDGGIESLESSVAHSPISLARLEELSKVFLQATELEIAFWDDAMKH